MKCNPEEVELSPLLRRAVLERSFRRLSRRAALEDSTLRSMLARYLYDRWAR